MLGIKNAGLRKRLFDATILLACALILAGCSNKARIFGETEVITIEGHLYRETFPGPPNYHSIENSDESEIYWILKIENPIRAKGESMEDGSPFMTAETRRIQLVLTQGQHDRWEEMLGQNVQASGEVFIGHTGHHHTPLLLDFTRGGCLELSGGTQQ